SLSGGATEATSPEDTAGALAEPDTPAIYEPHTPGKPMAIFAAKTVILRTRRRPAVGGGAHATLRPFGSVHLYACDEPNKSPLVPKVARANVLPIVTRISPREAALGANVSRPLSLTVGSGMGSSP